MHRASAATLLMLWCVARWNEDWSGDRGTPAGYDRRMLYIADHLQDSCNKQFNMYCTIVICDWSVQGMVGVECGKCL